MVLEKTMKPILFLEIIGLQGHGVLILRRIKILFHLLILKQGWTLKGYYVNQKLY